MLSWSYCVRLCPLLSYFTGVAKHWPNIFRVSGLNPLAINHAALDSQPEGPWFKSRPRNQFQAPRSLPSKGLTNSTR
jgi:hypothetical protein